MEMDESEMDPEDDFSVTFAHAVLHNQTKIVKNVLKRYGDQIDSQIKNMALIHSVENGRVSIVEALLTNCADLTDQMLSEAFLIAVSKDYLISSKDDFYQIIELFLNQYNERIDVQSKKRALEQACILNHQDISNLLLEKCGEAIFPSLNLNLVKDEMIDLDFMKASHYVYNEHLSKPYTIRSYMADWVLNTSFGMIQRPNHGLAHTLRVAALIPIVSQFLKMDLSQEEIKLLQIASLFSITGRENDCGFADNPALYKTFRTKSASQFLVYAKLINLDDEICDKYYNLVLHMGEQDQLSDNFKILILAHKLDLIRCYDDEQLERSIIKPLCSIMPRENVERLMNYSLSMILETGDRVKSYNQNEAKDYDELKFYIASTNAKFCWKIILSISKPEPDLNARYDLEKPKMRI